MEELGKQNSQSTRAESDGDKNSMRVNCAILSQAFRFGDPRGVSPSIKVILSEGER
jgi:hypothetical protein